MNRTQKILIVLVLVFFLLSAAYKVFSAEHDVVDVPTRDPAATFDFCAAVDEYVDALTKTKLSSERLDQIKGAAGEAKAYFKAAANAEKAQSIVREFERSIVADASLLLETPGEKVLGVGFVVCVDGKPYLVGVAHSLDKSLTKGGVEAHSHAGAIARLRRANIDAERDCLWLRLDWDMIERLEVTPIVWAPAPQPAFGDNVFVELEGVLKHGVVTGTDVPVQGDENVKPILATTVDLVDGGVWIGDAGAPVVDRNFKLLGSVFAMGVAENADKRPQTLAFKAFADDVNAIRYNGDAKTLDLDDDARFGLTE